MLLVTGAASAVLALGAAGAHASAGDWDDEGSSHSSGDSSYSKENGKEQGKEHSKEQGKEQGQEHSKEYDKHGTHDAPRGGMRTGGGALTAAGDSDWATASDPKFDPETYRDNGQDKESWGGGHDKPRGGMHTGGGALAAPSVTAGGAAVLAVAATGAFVVRRKKTAAGTA
jgi:hypothetical protein